MDKNCFLCGQQLDNSLEEQQNSAGLDLTKYCEQLRAALNKSQEDRRSLELQLVAEKAQRDQETKNAQTTVENNTIQLNAQIYAMKFEVESWKQKTEATSKESHLLKEQLKIVEAEKSAASKTLSETTEKNAGFDNFRKTFELYAVRIRDTIHDLTKQLCELQCAREELANLLQSFHQEVNVLNVFVKTQAECISFLEQRPMSVLVSAMSAPLENEIVEPKLE